MDYRSPSLVPLLLLAAAPKSVISVYVKRIDRVDN